MENFDILSPISGRLVGVEHIYRNMRRVCKRIAPNLKLPKKDPIGEDTIVMHLRSGDNYHRVFDTTNKLYS